MAKGREGGKEERKEEKVENRGSLEELEFQHRLEITLQTVENIRW